MVGRQLPGEVTYVHTNREMIALDQPPLHNGKSSPLPTSTPIISRSPLLTICATYTQQAPEHTRKKKEERREAMSALKLVWVVCQTQPKSCQNPYPYHVFSLSLSPHCDSNPCPSMICSNAAIGYHLSLVCSYANNSIQKFVKEESDF